MQVDMGARSRFADMTAEEAARAWKRRVIIINTVAVILTAAACLSYAFAQNPPGYLIIVVFVAYTCIFYTQWNFKTRNTAELTKIVTHDCDPAKMVEVIDLISPWNHNKSAHQGFAASYALCSTLMGYDDVALAWVEQTEGEGVKNAAVALSLVNTRASIARHRGDAKALYDLRPQAQVLAAEVSRNRDLANAASLVVASIERNQAFLAGNYADALALNQKLAGLAETPEASVMCAFGKGELDATLGDTESARRNFTFVAEHGGTMAVRRQAQEWLDAHSLGE